MLIEEFLKEERKEVRAEGRILALIDILLSLLAEQGVISKEQEDRIRNEKDVKILESWVRLASKTSSLEQFLSEI